MPEMPEVETIARKLRKAIVGKRVTGVRLSGLPLRKPVAAGFPHQLEGRVVRKIHRRGKYLIAEMAPQSFWLIHLGMSGRVCYGTADSPLANHTQAVVRFADGTELQYRDPRRFGLLAAYETLSMEDIPELKVLGKDPLARDFDAEWLFSKMHVSRQEVKSFLLDQRTIAGLGNIYACEALFLAGIHPGRRCFSLSKTEAAALVQAVRKTLRAAIQHRGTSFSDFIDLDGQIGAHQDFLNVFQREGKKCRRCGRSNVERIRQRNRSSFFCPRCQR